MFNNDIKSLGSRSSTAYFNTVRSTGLHSVNHLQPNSTGRTADKMNTFLKTERQINGFSQSAKQIDPSHFRCIWKMANIEEKEHHPAKVTPPPVKYRPIVIDLEQMDDEAEVPVRLGRNMRAAELREELEREKNETEDRLELEKKAKKLVNELLMKDMTELQIQQELLNANIPPAVIEITMALTFHQ